MQCNDNKDLYKSYFTQPRILCSETCCQLTGAARREGRGPSVSPVVPARAILLTPLVKGGLTPETSLVLMFWLHTYGHHVNMVHVLQVSREIEEFDIMNDYFLWNMRPIFNSSKLHLRWDQEYDMLQ